MTQEGLGQQACGGMNTATITVNYKVSYLYCTHSQRCAVSQRKGNESQVPEQEGEAAAKEGGGAGGGTASQEGKVTLAKVASKVGKSWECNREEPHLAQGNSRPKAGGTGRGPESSLGWQGLMGCPQAPQGLSLIGSLSWLIRLFKNPSDCPGLCGSVGGSLRVRLL